MTKEQSTYIKIVAIVTMFIDHVGYLLFPNILFLRIIGRIAFPLFAYQVGVSMQKTRSQKNYITRLFAFAFVLQAGFVVANFFMSASHFDIFFLNIFFTLVLGATVIFFFEKKNYFVFLFLIFLPFLLENFLQIKFDYGMYGVLTIFLLYLCQNNKLYLISTVLFLQFFYYQTGGSFFYQGLAALAILFIIKPLSVKLNIPSLVFYLFYPLHLLFLYLISLII